MSEHGSLFFLRKCHCEFNTVFLFPRHMGGHIELPVSVGVSWGGFGACVRAFVSFVKLHSLVGSVADLITGGCWFDPRLGQYSFRRLMIIITTGFIHLSPLSVVLTTVMWEKAASVLE